MGQFVVTGGRRLSGTFRVNGAKNAALPILAASLLVPEPMTLTNVPVGLGDVQHMMAILRTLGVRVTVVGPDTVVVDAAGPLGSEVPDALMRQMRASLFLAGPLLARVGEVRLAYPGGCDIGQRPIDLHLKGLQALGATFQHEAGGHLYGLASRLRGARIYLDYPSVGATENILMAATAAEGETVIVNAAQEPEIVDLAQCLMRMGAKIGGAGTRTIRVEGGHPLQGATHPIVPDRIEAGTIAMAAVITGGAVELVDCVPDHLLPVWEKLQEMGAYVDYDPGSPRVFVEAPMGRLTAVSVQTGPHPGFPTDLQPQLTALATQAEGVTVVRETVFENRLRHTRELARMGADVTVAGNVAWITGPTPLSGAPVVAADLRAGAALILAGLAADGETWIDGAERIERGYVDLPERLRALGARVERLDTPMPTPQSAT
jgi:UDP-N-acetylglucosamine 1-carboxyvinyltransferase